VFAGVSYVCQCPGGYYGKNCQKGTTLESIFVFKAKKKYVKNNNNDNKKQTNLLITS